MEKKDRKIGRRGRIRLIYAVALILYAAFVLLDAFVIPRDIISAAEADSRIDDALKTSINGEEYTPVVTGKSYDDGNIFIKIRTGRWLDTTLYIADVRIKDPSLMKTGLAGESFGRNLAENTSSIAERHGAVFAINGDYYGFRASGYVMRNGFLYRSESNTNYPYGEDLVIWKDGSFEITEEGAFTAEELEEQGAYQIFSFGPALVNHGEIKVVEDEEVERAQITNPRTAIGMVEPLHYIMVVSDGRTEESVGLSLYELGELMQRLGCDCAYNLDGGGSSTMWFNGEVLNKPTTYGDVIAERPISDIIYIGYPDDQE
jgi:exopolysaccharide biosynthesis protein